jgi:MFS family permease
MDGKFSLREVSSRAPDASYKYAVRVPGLVEAIPPSLATAVGISVAAHVAVYALTPVISLHLVALGGSSTQVGLLFAVFSLVAAALRPLAGAWIDQQGIRHALFAGVAIVVLASLGFQAAVAPPALIVLMAGFGIGYGLVTMAAAVLAASAPAAERGRALSIYYLAAPVSMAAAAPLGLWLFRAVGPAANFALVSTLGLVAGALGLWSRSIVRSREARPAGPAGLWSRGAVPLSLVLVMAAMGQSVLYTFLPLHASAHGQGHYLAWFFGLYSTAMIVFRVGVSRMADRWGRVRLLIPALALLAAGFGVLVAPPNPSRLALAALVLGAGSAALYPMLVAVVVDRVPDRERGVAMGMVSGAWDLGTFAGALTISAAVEHTSFGAGFAVASALIVLSLAGLLLAERRRTKVA